MLQPPLPCYFSYFTLKDGVLWVVEPASYVLLVGMACLYSPLVRITYSLSVT